MGSKETRRSESPWMVWQRGDKAQQQKAMEKYHWCQLQRHHLHLQLLVRMERLLLQMCCTKTDERHHRAWSTRKANPDGSNTYNNNDDEREMCGYKREGGGRGAGCE